MMIVRLQYYGGVQGSLGFCYFLSILGCCLFFYQVYLVFLKVCSDEYGVCQGVRVQLVLYIRSVLRLGKGDKEFIRIFFFFLRKSMCWKLEIRFWCLRVERGFFYFFGRDLGQGVGQYQLFWVLLLGVQGRRQFFYGDSKGCVQGRGDLVIIVQCLRGLDKVIGFCFQEVLLELDKEIILWLVKGRGCCVFFQYVQVGWGLVYEMGDQGRGYCLVRDIKLVNKMLIIGE